MIGRWTIACPLLLAALTVSNAAAQGRVVIAGGGVSRDNQALYSAMLEGRQGEGPICVIPTASASLDGARSSMDYSVETFNMHGGPGTAVGVLLSVENPAQAFDADVVNRIRQCSGYYFTGGVQSRTVRVLRPGGSPSPALEALLARFHFGAAVGGSSAGAAIMSDPMIAGGSTTTAIVRGVRRGPVEADEDDDGSAGGVSITPGIGFFRDAIVDQHFLARGRIGRLVAAVLGMEEYDLGFGVDEDTGLVADAGAAWAVGASGVIIVDAGQAVRNGRSAAGLVLHLMSTGDRFDLRTRRLTPGAGKTELPRTGPAISAPTDVFARWEFLHLLERFARSPQDRLAIPVEGGELVLRKGPDFLAAAADGTGVEGTPAQFIVRGLLLDVVIP